MDGVARFDDRAQAYASARPGYPEAALQFLLSSATSQRFDSAIDIGAGTAISSNLLADHCRLVFALDPNLNMLRAARIGPAVKRIAGRAERLPFKDAATRLITVFNAFHWFQPDAFFTEAHRVIAPGGRLALIWNDWDLSDNFTSSFVKLMRSCAGDHPPEDRESEVSPLYKTTLFGNIVRQSFENIHQHNLDSLRRRLQSISYIPTQGAVWEHLDREMTRLYDQFRNNEGLVMHRYHTSVFVADRS